MTTSIFRAFLLGFAVVAAVTASLALPAAALGQAQSPMYNYRQCLMEHGRGNFQADDGVNVCTCGESGIICTKMAPSGR